MNLTNKIQKRLMAWVNNNADIIVPNFYYGRTECDVFKITGSDFIMEYEIKISRSDFLADFKKQKGNKHFALKYGNHSFCPNRFFYVMPEGLIKVDECPKYAGLLFFNQHESFDVLKNAPMLHKRKFNDFKRICKTLAFRESQLRGKINRISNGSLERELSETKRLAEQEHDARVQAQHDLFLLKFSKQKLNSDKNVDEM